MSAPLPADRVLDALGNPVRRQIVVLLAQGPRAVGALAAEFPISRPAVSKHLRLLEGAGLVRHRAAGTANVFELDQAGFLVARRWLDDFWREGLADFKALAEATWEPS